MSWSIERSESVNMKGASRRDVVESMLVWVRRGDEGRRITLELTREAFLAGCTLDPVEHVTPFLGREEPPLHLFVTSDGVVELVPPSER